MDPSPPPETTLRAYICNRSALFLFSVILVMELAAWLYSVSLGGGSVGYIKENLALFGVCMLLAVLIVLVTNVAAVFFCGSVRLPVKLAALAIGWGLFLRTALSDTDTTMLHHGHYNFAAFLCLFISGFALSLLAVCSLKLVKVVNPGLCLGLFMLLTSMTWALWMFASTSAFRTWNKGINTDLHMSWPECSLEFSSIPWLGVIPTRSLNFFCKCYLVGSNNCPEVEEFASLSEDGYLRLQCDSEEVKIVENPDFISQRESQWILEECGLVGWKDALENKEKHYKLPGHGSTHIKSEYFQVFCGKRENYFVQNVKNQTLIDTLAQFPTTPRMNLIVFQIDNLSRAHFMRTMTETVQTLKEFEAAGDIELAEMMRVVTVGFNTEFNTKAMYTGSQFRQRRGGRAYWDVFRAQGNVAMYLNGKRHF